MGNGTSKTPPQGKESSQFWAIAHIRSVGDFPEK